MQVQGELLRGNIDTIILKCLFDGEKYGNEIMKDIEDRTSGQFIIKQPTLYSALTRLENQGLVSCTWVSTTNGGRRKYFAITQSGLNFFKEKQHEWEISHVVVDKFISEKIFSISQKSDVKVETIQPEPAREIRVENLEINSKPTASKNIDESDLQNDLTQRLAEYVNRYGSYAASLAAEVKEDRDAPEPPQFITFESDDLDALAAEQPSVAPAIDGKLASLIEENSTPTEKFFDNLAATPATKEDAAALPSDRKPTKADELTADVPSTEQKQSYAPAQPFIQAPAHTAAQAPKINAAISNDPLRAVRTEEEELARTEALKQLYSPNPKTSDKTPIENARAVREIDLEPEVDDYKSVLSTVFSDNLIAVSESCAAAAVPTNTSSALVLAGEKETLTNGVVFRRHNRELSKEYNAKYYVYANKLRLIQFVILAAMMLVETVAIYLGLVMGAKLNNDIWLYFTALVITLAFPILAGVLFFSKPNETGRIRAATKNTFLYRFLTTLECIVLIFCINILVDNSVLTTTQYLTRIILPCVLSTNFILGEWIYQLLAKCGRFAVKSQA